MDKTIGLNSSVSELFAASRSGAGNPAPERTGRFIITWKDQAAEAGQRLLREQTGLPIASAADFRGQAADFAQLPQSGALVLPNLNSAVLTGEPDQVTALSSITDAESPILSIEPEYFVYATGMDAAYIQGFRDGVNVLADKLIAPPPTAPSRIAESSTATWGLLACGVPSSRFSGAGIRVAVLDTGLDLQHPDFQGRSITSKSFIQGQEVQDENGHGTHCIGTACGPVTSPFQPPRYGIAYNSLIVAGKVLDNSGTGTDATILAGIDWALELKCPIISMSLSRRVQPGEAPQQVYENAGAKALQNGCIIIAAAGNDSFRPFNVVPVGSPANASTIFAVASVGEKLAVSFFSNGGVNPNGGEVNIAGPGENVYSTIPMPRRYGIKSGTSMATPHVAGIAALYAESDPSLRGQALWKRLTENAKDIGLPATDAGAGLLQAP
jgi:subtilisin family serine protease